MIDLTARHYGKIVIILVLLAVLSFTVGGAPERYVYGGF
ncbi:hypothetical protein FHT92_003719 [Rhizobium sp. BK377]|nr:hypothetical protein [Rhizobium sp. BK377]